MNGLPLSGQNGPTVRMLSGQVRGLGPNHNSGTKSGPTYPPPPKGAVGGGGPFQIIHCNTPNSNQSKNQPDPDDLPDHEPTDEELWLEAVARQVEADARPLFAATWIWLLRRALEHDEDEPPS